MRFAVLAPCLLAPTLALANPHWDPTRVPVDRVSASSRADARVFPPLSARAVAPVLRVQLDWDATSDTFVWHGAYLEPSGTPGLLARSPTRPELGSYIGALANGSHVVYDSVGTGAEYRRLTRAVSFRFPWDGAGGSFSLTAENPSSGKPEVVFQRKITAKDVVANPAPSLGSSDLDVRTIRPAADPAHAVTIALYAEGYAAKDKAAFFSRAEKVAALLAGETGGARFPGAERFEVTAVFYPSVQALGKATNLGLPIPERNSHLGLYFVYWENFGRWYHVLYPTREEHFRNALGVTPYDTAIALVNDNQYWGVGNFMSHTAVPANHSSLRYLLFHELGHTLGLNEEYEGGGRTELEFAPNIEEPWSPNMTFLSSPNLKWASFVNAGTPIPTPASHWWGGSTYGAYAGGYADSVPGGGRHNHKPGFGCVMESGSTFCPVCDAALHRVVDGLSGP